jgi:hypothetical protein
MEVSEFEERAKYQKGYDRELGNWKVIDVHQIPYPILEQFETDFYCCNGRHVFLLRIRNRKIKKLDFVKSNTLTYLIAELPLTVIDDNIIENLLNEFELKYLKIS